MPRINDVSLMFVVADLGRPDRFLALNSWFWEIQFRDLDVTVGRDCAHG